MKITRFLRRPMALLMVAAACAAPGAPALALSAAAPLPVEAFFKKPALMSPRLSPNGKRIAMLVPTASGRMGVAIADIGTPDKFKGIAQFEDADVRSVTWVNDERLVFDAVDFQATAGDQLGSGLYAVNADGSDFLWLIERTGNYRVSGNPAKRPLANRYLYIGPLRDGSDDVMVQRMIPTQQGSPATSMMMRLNTKALTVKSIYTGSMPDGVQEWILDREQQPRVVVSTDGKRQNIVHWREVGSNSWTELFRFDQWEDITATTPEAVGPSGELYVRALNPDSADGTMALYRYDLANKKVDGKPILNLPGFDFEGSMIFDSVTKQLLGVSYEQETGGVMWFDKSMRATQETIDKLLPSTNNAFSCSNCSAVRHLIVTASSDIQAPIHFLFDKQTSKLSLLGQSYPWLQSTAMAGTMDFQRIKARDGMMVPTYITKPKGKGPFPTVVLVHGGPNVRGNSWGFNPQTQFLASRGYLVIEPEFRGSRGYGSKLFKSGWKQWGLTMQDDVTDATKWAIAQGLADSKRVAIAGASYGGYATMMGLVKEPELYKAGINWVGVTDVAMMYTIGYSDFMDADSPWMKYGMPLMIGTQKTDGAQLTATSPLQQAARIKQPVLMGYGELDYRVPLVHGTKMRDALKANGNNDVEFVTYPGEAHNWMLTKTQVDFWTRVENFLARTLK